MSTIATQRTTATQRINYYLTQARLSTILYHSTSLHALFQILEQDKFQLTPSLGTDSDNLYTKPFFLSLTRSRVGQYHYPVSDYHSATTLLVVDGDLLERRGFTGGPVNYWGPDYKHTKNEMEDRIFSDKSEIPNAHSYIKEIHFFGAAINKRDSSSDAYVRLLRKALFAAKLYKIPFYIYDSAKDFNLLNKLKARTTLPNLKTPPVDSYYSSSRTDWFARYTELLYATDRSKLSRDAAYQLSRILGRWDNKESISSLKSDMHNSKTGTSQPNFIKFYGHMKKFNLKDAKDVIEFIRNKWQSED